MCHWAKGSHERAHTLQDAVQSGHAAASKSCQSLPFKPQLPLSRSQSVTKEPLPVLSAQQQQLRRQSSLLLQNRRDGASGRGSMATRMSPEEESDSDDDLFLLNTWRKVMVGKETGERQPREG